MLVAKLTRLLVPLAVLFLTLTGPAMAQRDDAPMPVPPDDSRPEAWTQHQAAHLLRRAGFGGTPAEVGSFVTAGRSGAIEALVNSSGDTAALDAQLARLQLDLTTRAGIQRWWVARMLLTPRPLEERMTLFWHDHFATAISKVNRADLMLRQNQTFRRLALGNFRQLLLEVARDPAMLVWLDNRLNRRGNPNENFARELMELFTIGIGNYTEQDVHEVARAFTGWTLDREGNFSFNRNQHDFGAKTILGRTGNFDGTDVIDLLAARPETARLLSRKLWEFFAYSEPEDEIVDRLAIVYLSSGGDMRAVVRAMLESPEFYSPAAMRAIVKSPVDFVIGTIRSGLGSMDVAAIPGFLRRMGQEPFNPPNVGGWPGGLEWIGTSTMLERLNFANRAVSSRTGPMDTAALRQTLEAANARDAGAVADYLLDRMVGGTDTMEMRRVLIDYLGGASFRLEPRTIDMKVRGAIYLVAASPNYQMN